MLSYLKSSLALKYCRCGPQGSSALTGGIQMPYSGCEMFFIKTFSNPWCILLAHLTTKPQSKERAMGYRDLLGIMGILRRWDGNKRRFGLHAGY